MLTTLELEVKKNSIFKKTIVPSHPCCQNQPMSGQDKSLGDAQRTRGQRRLSKLGCGWSLLPLPLPTSQNEPTMAGAALDILQF